jgi:uncharacterized protein (TIGR02246 family)
MGAREDDLGADGWSIVREGRAMSLRQAGVIRLVVLLLSGVLLAPGLVASKTRDDASSVMGEVRARADEYKAVWDTHDPDAVAAFYTPDADMVMGSSPSITGRTEIREWWARYFSRIDPQRHISLQVETARPVSSEVVIVNVRTRTGGTGSGGGELPSRLARGTWIMVRQDGKWLISALRGLPAEGDRRTEPGVDR